jgi:hypothetical protein
MSGRSSVSQWLLCGQAQENEIEYCLRKLEEDNEYKMF